MYQFFFQNRNDFSLIYGDLTICNVAAVRNVEFFKFTVYVTFIAMLLCSTVLDFVVITQSAAEI